MLPTILGCLTFGFGALGIVLSAREDLDMDARDVALIASMLISGSVLIAAGALAH